MTQNEVPCYTLISSGPDLEPISEAQFRADFQKGDDQTKIQALKRLIRLMINGEKFPSLLMVIIRDVMGSTNRTLKKLLLIFWEVVPKHTADGKLLQEMILVCDAYRKDLQHSNEFIRGSTLRFLCKLKEPEILEPLMPSIRACLEYRHAYVRRNAVLAIFTIYKNFAHLIPDAPELVEKFLEIEQDMSCRRNAFLMLIHVDQERALNYLSNVIDQVNSFGDILQLVIVELIYKVCYNNPQERARFIRCIYNLLNSTSLAVRYEAAGTLITLSSAPTAIRAAASCYIDLIVKESDNNVKLIVLDRLIDLKENSSNERILQDLVMDILRVLGASDLEAKKKTLKLCYELVTSKSINEVVLFLRKEVTKTNNDQATDDQDKYRQALIRTLHQCTMKFPDIASTIVPVLIEFLSDRNELAALDILVFVREVLQKLANLTDLIIQSLLDICPSIQSAKVLRSTLWLLAEYCTSIENIQNSMTVIRQSLGDLPIVEDEIRRASGEKVNDTDIPMTTSVKTLVTVDGTYATQSALTTGNQQQNSSSSSKTNKIRQASIRSFLMDGEFFLGSVLSISLCKLVFRYVQRENDLTKQNRFCAEAMFIIANILHLGRSNLAKTFINEDDHERMICCLRMISDRLPFTVEVIGSDCRRVLNDLLLIKHQEKLEAEKKINKDDKSKAPDDPIRFGQLFSNAELDEKEDILELTLKQALSGTKKKDDPFAASLLSKVTQLTGFSDPVYAEAYVNVNQHDIVLDILIVNQSSDTLQNLTVELVTLGDLKLVEKPQPITVGGHDFSNIKASIKVDSTENGIIFGNIVYDLTGAQSDRNCIIMNDIHVDIMDYIYPTECTDEEFRQMWVEFEWENKVSVNTNVTDLRHYLLCLLKITNMRCLTPEKGLSGECGFLAANLCAKSIFGEDVIANLSIEKSSIRADLPVTGHVRIRSRSQGMAVSMGDKINLTQKTGFKSLLPTVR